jgi:Fur family ferric uptake transcriptional regulator
VTELSLNTIKKQLQEAGFKLTPQREATVSVLLEKEKEHLSAEEIFLLLRLKHPDIGLATVYRTLEILTELNITYKVVFEDGLSRYDLRRTSNEHFHHHLLCIECGNIEEIHEDLLGEVEKDVESRYQFVVKDHRLTFHGICRDCQQKLRNK